MSSRFTSGVRINEDSKINVKAGKRSWDIKLFPTYPKNSKKSEIADFYIERTDKNAKNTIPTMIEAKRAYLYKNNKPRSQILKIKEDIKKLRVNCANKLRGYILVWSIATNDREKPYNFLSRLDIFEKPDIIIREVRQVPLYVIKSFKLENHNQTKKWLWVALVEVTKLYPGDPRPPGYSDC